MKFLTANSPIRAVRVAALIGGAMLLQYRLRRPTIYSQKCVARQPFGETEWNCSVGGTVHTISKQNTRSISYVGIDCSVQRHVGGTFAADGAAVVDHHRGTGWVRASGVTPEICGWFDHVDTVTSEVVCWWW